MDAVVLRMKGDRAAAEKTFAKAQALRPSDPAVAGGFDAAFARLAPQLFPASP
jgi:Flp pilus assembly protein TadD